MGHSCSSLRKTKAKSNPALAKPTLNGIRPAQLLTLPPLLFTSRSHFTIENTTITRSSTNVDSPRYLYYSSIVLKTPATNGILSVTLVILSLPNVGYGPGGIMIGLLDSTAPVPEVAQCLGIQMKNSVSISSSSGLLWIHRQLVQDVPQHESCHFFLKEGDCVRMEVDMESTPRTVQFFVNGESGRCFISLLMVKEHHSESTELQNSKDQRFSLRKLEKSHGNDVCISTERISAVLSKTSDIESDNTQTTSSVSSCLGNTVVSWMMLHENEIDPLELGLYSASEKTNRRFKTTTQQSPIYLLSLLIDGYDFVCAFNIVIAIDFSILHFYSTDIPINSPRVSLFC
ncbi:hypothetical protein BLNAU_17259 [Blattamonas nauphoetae]|uniref:Uncharacterized protein n=1 Tax=Blattamonas nauphoetae TaxID=2049346 RepID=A0ABQ9X7M4_9EUKA|nr:hypothetical protein BLNAU_17259 [Blattamonas nauphoetae]